MRKKAYRQHVLSPAFFFLDALEPKPSCSKVWLMNVCVLVSILLCWLLTSARIHKMRACMCRVHAARQTRAVPSSTNQSLHGVQ